MISVKSVLKGTFRHTSGLISLGILGENNILIHQGNELGNVTSHKPNHSIYTPTRVSITINCSFSQIPLQLVTVSLSSLREMFILFLFNFYVIFYSIFLSELLTLLDPRFEYIVTSIKWH